MVSCRWALWGKYFVNGYSLGDFKVVSRERHFMDTIEGRYSLEDILVERLFLTGVLVENISVRSLSWRSAPLKISRWEVSLGQLFHG